MSERPFLMWLIDSAGQREVELDSHVQYRVGSSAALADLVLSAEDVDPLHAMLQFDAERSEWRYTDLGSRAGSFSLGARVTELGVAAFDELTVGARGGRIVFRPHPGALRGPRGFQEEVWLASQTDEPLVLFGPAGSGKTALAHVLAPGLTVVACGAAEFVGRVAASHGAILIDDLQELSAERALALGAAIEEHQRARRGRLLCATRVPLSELALDARLSERLLPGQMICTPELVAAEVKALARSFLTELAVGRGLRCEVSEEALAALAAYAWPGGRLELTTVCRQLVRRAAQRSQRAIVIDEELVRRELQARAAVETPRRTLTRELIVESLREHAGAIATTARALGVARNTLKAKMAAFGIQR